MFILSFQNGGSALMVASQNGHKEIVKYLIEAKASLDLKTQVYSASNQSNSEFFNKISIMNKTYWCHKVISLFIVLLFQCRVSAVNLAKQNDLKVLFKTFHWSKESLDVQRHRYGAFNHFHYVIKVLG